MLGKALNCKETQQRKRAMGESSFFFFQQTLSDISFLQNQPEHLHQTDVASTYELPYDNFKSNCTISSYVDFTHEDCMSETQG